MRPRFEIHPRGETLDAAHRTADYERHVAEIDAASMTVTRDFVLPGDASLLHFVNRQAVFTASPCDGAWLSYKTRRAPDPWPLISENPTVDARAGVK